MVSVVNYCSLQKSLTVEQRLESSVQTRKPLKVDAEPNSPEIVRNEPDGNKKVETQDLLKYKCSLCNEQFKREDRLNRHLFSHTKQKFFCCDLDGCSKQYTNRSHLNRHKKSSHEAKPEIASVVCKQPNCHQTFTNRSNMNRHYQTHHANPLPYSCSQCPEKFRRKLQLKKHEIQKHTGKHAYSCAHCSRGFFNQFTFLRHLTTHNLENPQRPCPDCGVMFFKWSTLVEHRRKWHKNVPRITCDLCGKTFSRKPNIKQHMSLHLLKEGTVFQCTYDNCPKFYTADRNLKSHIRSKHEGKRWNCDLCMRQLSTQQKLQQHIRAHLDPNRAHLLAKKPSMISQLVGVKLPDDVEQQILEGKGSQVEVDSFLPPIESTNETSGAEFSDF